MVKQLQIDTIALLSATRIEDVTLGPDFQGETIGQLMIHMLRYGLQFEEPQPDERATYEVLYREMVRYYLALHSIVQAVEYDQGQLDALAERDQKLFDLQYEDTLTRAGDMLGVPSPDSLEARALRWLDIAEKAAEIYNKLFGGKKAEPPYD
jgi:hypothetical protein